MSVTALAASDLITVVNNLSDFVFGLIRAIGLILLGPGIVRIGFSLKSHDLSQRASGFPTLTGGIITTSAREVPTLIAGQRNIVIKWSILGVSGMPLILKEV